MKKKSVIVLLAAILAMAFVLSACGKTAPKAEEQAVGMANPNLYDVGYEEAAKLISLTAPEGAENVKYNIIGYQSENPMIEMAFQLNGVAYYERAQASAVLSILKDSEAEGALVAIPDNHEINLSGIYAQFDTMATTVVGHCDGIACGSKEGSFVAWVDAVPGIMYNLCTTEKVDLMDLQALAGQVFVPVQGDS